MTNMPEVMEFKLGQDPESFRKPRRSRTVDLASRRFNEALWRIINGKCHVGGITHELAAITGLSPEAIRRRVDDIEYEPAPLDPQEGLTSNDLKYLMKVYKHSDNPVVRDFFRGLSGGQRKDPNHENARVKRQRIGNKLISLADDLPH